MSVSTSEYQRFETFSLRFTQKVTYTLVADTLLDVLQVSIADLAGVQLFTDFVAMVKLVSPQVFHEFLSRYDGKVVSLPAEQGTVVVTNESKRITYVFIRKLHFDVPDDAVLRVLQRYGDTFGIRRNRVSFGRLRGVPSGIRTVKMALASDIPSVITAAGARLNVVYQGQPRTCFRCNGTGHLAAACSGRAPVHREPLDARDFPTLQEGVHVGAVDLGAHVHSGGEAVEEGVRGVQDIRGLGLLPVPAESVALSEVVPRPVAGGAAPSTAVDSVPPGSGGVLEAGMPPTLVALEPPASGGAVVSELVPGLVVPSGVGVVRTPAVAVSTWAPPPGGDDRGSVAGEGCQPVRGLGGAVAAVDLPSPALCAGADGAMDVGLHGGGEGDRKRRRSVPDDASVNGCAPTQPVEKVVRRDVGDASGGSLDVVTPGQRGREELDVPDSLEPVVWHQVPVDSQDSQVLKVRLRRGESQEDGVGRPLVERPLACLELVPLSEPPGEVVGGAPASSQGAGL